jgi:hypothetical protein
MGSIDFRAIRDLVPLRDLLHRIGWMMVKEGTGNVRCPCPIRTHTKYPHRAVAVGEREWFCQKCKRGGDVVDFLSMAINVNVYAAARRVCQYAGVKVPYLPRRRRSQSFAERRRGTEWGPRGEPPRSLF